MVHDSTQTIDNYTLLEILLQIILAEQYAYNFGPKSHRRSLCISACNPESRSNCDLYTMRDRTLSKSTLNTDFTLG